MPSRQLQGCSVLCVLCAVQIESLLGKKLDSIYEGNASALRVLSVVGPEGFHLRDRAVHVYSEAGRVYAFRDVCKVGLPSLWALMQGKMSGVTGRAEQKEHQGHATEPHLACHCGVCYVVHSDVAGLKALQLQCGTCSVGHAPN